GTVTGVAYSAFRPAIHQLAAIRAAIEAASASRLRERTSQFAGAGGALGALNAGNGFGISARKKAESRASSSSGAGLRSMVLMVSARLPWPSGARQAAAGLDSNACGRPSR